MIDESIFDDLKKYKNRIAVIEENFNKKTYKQLISDSEFFNKNFLKKNVILILCDNNYESIAGYLGLLRNKSIPYLIDNSLNKFEVNNLLSKYKINYIYLPKKRVKEFKNYKKFLDFFQYCLIKTNNYFPYMIFNDLALLLSTSGSVGNPKCVRLSKKNIISNSQSIIKFLNINKSDRVITTLNPSYSYGLSIINTHLLSGATLVLTKLTFFDKFFWKLLNKANVNTFGGVPFHYQILKKIKFENFDISSLKYITHAGGLIQQDTKNYILKVCKLKKIKFISMYGATEATARMSYIPWNFKNKSANCIGKAIPGGKFWIENKKKLTKFNSIGQLVYSGENVSLGYANTYKDLKKRDTNNGILKTGDLAKLGKDNYYYLVGRKSRIIKINGYRIDLDFIENKLRSNNIYSLCYGKDEYLEIFYTNIQLKKKITNLIKKISSIRKNNFKLKLVDKSHPVFLKRKKTLN